MGTRIFYVILEEEQQGIVQGLNKNLIRYGPKITNITNNSLFISIGHFNLIFKTQFHVMWNRNIFV